MINEKEISRHFSEQVIRRAYDMNIPLSYVAYYSETSEDTFKKYMEGIRLPRITTLIMVAELLECDVNALLGYDSFITLHRKRKFDSGMDSNNLRNRIAYMFIYEIHSQNINLGDMARTCDMTETTLRNTLERGSMFTTKQFLSICKMLNLTPSYILGY